jgi:hypothetical protein
VKQPWYADDAGAAGNFDSIRSHFIRLQQIGPTFGYFEKYSCRAPENLEAAKLAFADLGFEVTTGHRYLGGFLGEQDALENLI